MYLLLVCLSDKGHSVGSHVLYVLGRYSKADCLNAI